MFHEYNLVTYYREEQEETCFMPTIPPFIRNSQSLSITWNCHFYTFYNYFTSLSTFCYHFASLLRFFKMSTSDSTPLKMATSHIFNLCGGLFVFYNLTQISLWCICIRCSEVLYMQLSASSISNIFVTFYFLIDCCNVYTLTVSTWVFHEAVA